MVWIKNFFTSKKFNQDSTVENSGVTFGELKNWCKQELPALGWQKLKLRVSKVSKEKYDFCFDNCPDTKIIPVELLEIINNSIQELFDKKFLN